MTVREIQGFLAEQYGTTVSPEFSSSVTDEVLAEVTAWQQRPLEPMYPVVFFDAMRVKIRDDGIVRNKAVYLALGVLPKTRGHFPNDEAACKPLWLAIENIRTHPTGSAHHWSEAMNQLAVFYGDRFSQHPA